MMIVPKFHVLIFYTFQEISRQRSGRAGSSFQVIQLVLNGHQTLFQFIPTFLKVLELFECRRGDPYTMSS